MKTILPSDLYQLLGGLAPADFLAGWWQKQPLLIKNAIPGFKPLISKADLFALAKQDEVESRLVTRRGKLWQLDHGPFTARDFRRKVDNTVAKTVATTADNAANKAANKAAHKAAGEKWSLLVQGVNLHNAQADALLRRFSFIPYARLDDLMISYANHGGGVGPHFDPYDVFLLQAAGKRRWRVSMQRDKTLLPGAPLKILKNFKHTMEWTLEPGDMLYLPPGCAHEGVADGECMTYSIGFRAPSAEELARGFLEYLAETVVRQGFYADPGLKPAARAALIDDAYVKNAAQLVGSLKPSVGAFETFLGCRLTEPKADVFFDTPESATGDSLTPAQFAAQVRKHGAALDRKTQMLYRGKRVFINGEIAPVVANEFLKSLADARRTAPRNSRAEEISSANIKAIYPWYIYGWLHPLETS